MNKSAHFFKIHSRIGMKNSPFKGTAPNIGVEEGPEAILSPQFLPLVFTEKLKIDEFTFSNPEVIAPDKFNQVLAQELQGLQELIASRLKPQETGIAVGGDHTLSFSTISACLKRAGDPSKVGYIQFDTHPDMMTESSSSTGNFHGMYLRPLIKTAQGVDFDISEINALVKRQLDPRNMLFIGNLDPEEEEKRFFISQEIRNLTGEEISSSLDKVLRELSKWVSQFEYLHINFDIDVFNASIASATGCPSLKGLFPEQVFPLLEVLSAHSNILLDLVEVNPKKEGASETVHLAQQVISVILG